MPIELVADGDNTWGNEVRQVITRVNELEGLTTSTVNLSLASKANVGHNHAITEVTGLQAALDSKAAVGTGGGSGVTAHSALTGLSNDDHTQYHNDTRGDARYYTKIQSNTALAEKADFTALAGKANATHTHGVTDLTASGTRDGTKFLRDDNTWAVPSGGGGTSNTLAVINVKTDFGATGNGSTPDHVAIQNALNAAGSANYGGTVYLPPGVYLISKYLLIPSNVVLMGAGMDLSIIRSSGSTFRTAGGVAPDGGGYSVLQATGTTRNNITIRDLTVDGNESTDRTALAASGVRLNSYLVDMRSVTGLRIDRVATRNPWTYSIAVLDGDKIFVTGCDVRDPGTTGVYDQLDGIHIWGSTRVRVLGNYVDNGVGGDADDAMACHVFSGGTSASDLVFANNVARGGANGNGIQIAGDATATITGVTVSGNTFWGCKAGFMLQWFSASGGGAIRSVGVTGNVFRNMTGDSAINIIAGGGGRFDDVAITGNVIDGYGKATIPEGIYVQGGNSSRGLSIVGNQMRGGYGTGITFVEGSPVRDYIIANNVIDMSSAQVAPRGIQLGSSLDGVVSGNIITGRGTADGQGVYLSSTTSATATNQVITGNRVRAFATGVQVTNVGGNNPTNTLFTGNNTQGNGTATNFGTATVTSANNI